MSVLKTIGLSKPMRMLLIGAPGVGKGTQTSRLLERYPQLSAISSGDLLRDNVRKGTELAPTATINPEQSFILDGFPRTTTQASQLATFLPLNFVVHLNTPSDIILSRIANRWIHPASGRVYNTKFNPPKVPGRDDITGQPLVQRADDSIETWRKRLGSFEESSGRLLSWYHGKKDDQGRDIVWRVDGNSSDEISPKLFEEVERRFR
ncbi:hypothetical protein KEM54_005957 [Ascosphaera aggregata]|nr:hypothetical protein KEM54_005957 [Ascosphaera aggregata]